MLLDQTINDGRREREATNLLHMWHPSGVQKSMTGLRNALAVLEVLAFLALLYTQQNVLSFPLNKVAVAQETCYF